jgi:hypothetical protein
VIELSQTAKKEKEDLLMHLSGIRLEKKKNSLTWLPQVMPLLWTLSTMTWLQSAINGMNQPQRNLPVMLKTSKVSSKKLENTNTL